MKTFYIFFQAECGIINYYEKLKYYTYFEVCYTIINNHGELKLYIAFFRQNII